MWCIVISVVQALILLFNVFILVSLSLFYSVYQQEAACWALNGLLLYGSARSIYEEPKERLVKK